MTICNSHILPRVEDTVGGTVCKLHSCEWNVKKNYLKNIGINFELLSKRLIINNIVKNINESLSDYSGIRPTMWRGWGSLSKKMELNKWGPTWAYLGLSGRDPSFIWAQWIPLSATLYTLLISLIQTRGKFRLDQVLYHYISLSTSVTKTWLDACHSWQARRKIWFLLGCTKTANCQLLVFFLSDGSARARDQSRAWSFACLAPFACSLGCTRTFYPKLQLNFKDFSKWIGREHALNQFFVVI